MKEAFCSNKLLCTFQSPSVFEFPVSIFWWSKNGCNMGGDMVGNFLPQTSASSFHPKNPSWLGFLVWHFRNFLSLFLPMGQSFTFFFLRLNIKGGHPVGYLLRLMVFWQGMISAWLCEIEGSIQEISVLLHHKIREDRPAQETSKDKPNKRTQTIFGGEVPSL